MKKINKLECNMNQGVNNILHEFQDTINELIDNQNRLFSMLNITCDNCIFNPIKHEGYFDVVCDECVNYSKYESRDKG